MPKADTPQRPASRRRRAHGGFRRLGHAGQLRLADRRAPRRAHRRRHVRRVAHARRRRRRDGSPRLPALRAGQQRRPAGNARQGALFVPAQARRDRAGRSHRLFPARGSLPAGRQRGHRGQGHRVVPRAPARTRSDGAADTAHRRRDHRGAGAECGARAFESAARRGEGGHGTRSRSTRPFSPMRSAR